MLNKRVQGLLLGSFALLIALTACGDATNTSPAASITPTGAAMSGSMTTATATTPAMAGSMPSMTTASTTVATTTMSSMVMSPSNTMGTSSSAMTTTATTDAMTQSLAGLSGKNFEVKFMQEMIAHHQEAIQMAQLVASHTKRPELIQLSQNIINSQNKEIADQTGWLSSWYNEKPLANPMSAPGMMEMMGDMSKLQNAKDADFDKLFLQMMIPHHEGAVSMANLLPTRTQRPELLQLGQNIIKAQTAEIAQMQGWLKAWFNA